VNHMCSNVVVKSSKKCSSKIAVKKARDSYDMWLSILKLPLIFKTLIQKSSCFKTPCLINPVKFA
jgi:hypothetical protein